MKKYSEIILKYLWLIAACCAFTACEKEHLQPDITGSQTQPLVFISAILGTDTVHLEGGVDSYIGQAWVADTGSLRYFCFYLYDENNISPPKRCFKIYVNNSRFNLGVPEQDMDSTIVADSLYYQDYSNGFIPSAVTVEWYDSTGTQFSSAMWPQFNNFVITSVEDISYANRLYKKATVEFDCTLMDSTFNFIPLTNGRATLLFVADPHAWRPGESIIDIN